MCSTSKGRPNAVLERQKNERLMFKYELQNRLS